MSIDDKFIHQSMYSPVCTHCNNLISEATRTCTAFNIPDKIPDKIWEGKNKHLNPVRGDNNIQFIPVTKEKLEQDLARL